jgi:Rrf2 family protein
MNKRIAFEEGIPAPYLSKLLQHFARLELLRSTKGPTGGFALELSPRQVRLIDIVAPLDGLAKYRRCAGGLPECSDEMPCSMHKKWTELRGQILAYLENTTLEDLAAGISDKEKALQRKKKRARRRVRRA